MGASLERFVERHSSTADRRSDRLVPVLPCRTLLDGIGGQVISAAVFLAIFGVQWWRHNAHSKHQCALARSEDVPGVAEKCDRFVVVVLTPVGNIVER